MTYQTISHAVNNGDLQKRVTAAVIKEAWANMNFYNSTYGKQVRVNPPGTDNIPYFMWPVAIANEVDYAYVWDVRKDDPTEMAKIGNDAGVISDADILDAVQRNWPPEPATPTPSGGGVVIGIG